VLAPAQAGAGASFGRYGNPFLLVIPAPAFAGTGCSRNLDLFPHLPEFIPVETGAGAGFSGKLVLRKIFIQISLDSRFRGNDEWDSNKIKSSSQHKPGSRAIWVRINLVLVSCFRGDKDGFPLSRE